MNSNHSLQNGRRCVTILPPVYHNKPNQSLPTFSCFDGPIYNTKPSSSINIRDLYQKITSDSLLEQTCTRIRTAEHKQDRDSIKDSELPYITPSGTFRHRSDGSLINHAGYLCIDIDHLTQEQAVNFKRVLKEDSNIPTVLLFLSPSGRGLKWIVKIPESAPQHKSYFSALQNYIQTSYGIEIDETCSDISRACYLSHDKDAYFAPALLELAPLNEQFLKQWQPEAKPQKAPLAPFPDQQQLQQVESLVRLIQERQVDITSSYREWINVGFALCRLGEGGRPYFHHISQYHPKYTWGETDEKFTELQAAYDGRIGLGTLFHIAKAHGLHPDTLRAEHFSSFVSSGQINHPASDGTTRTANQRLEDAKCQAPIKQLVGSIWNTGELHILFGDNGTGKSVWSVQIADALTKGENVLPILPNENGPLKVLYYDFELSDAQFQKRYVDAQGQPYDFSELLLFGRIDFKTLYESYGRKNPDEVIISKIEADIQKHAPQVLIVDNLSYLKTETTQDAKVALDLVKNLNRFKTEYDLSILALSHTPKTKPGFPITNNDLAGSKQLSNLVDSISAIGKSTRSKDEKYIKQIKCRTGENLYDLESVISCSLHKDERFLRFSFCALENEYEHLKDVDKEQRAIEKEIKKAEALRLHEEGLSFREIEAELGVSKSSIQRWIKEL